MEFYFGFAESEHDLHGILALQKKNLVTALDNDEILSQGFVTVNHSFDQLQELSKIEKQVVCKVGGRVIGYLLAMTTASKQQIPALIPMFEMFEHLQLDGKPLSAYQYVVVGQVCIDKDHRGKGLLSECYSEYKKAFRDRYDFAITEIAARNARSLRAHARVGFQELSRYIESGKEEWVIVYWKF